MTTDNRTNEPSRLPDFFAPKPMPNGYVPVTQEPTEAQVEAAAKAMHGTGNPWFAAYGDWGAAGFEIKKAFRESASAALEAAARAAQGAAPQADSRRSG